jgi:hypothetical protein
MRVATRSRSWWGCGVLVLLAMADLVAGCGDYTLNFKRTGAEAAANKRKPELWTMFDIRAARTEARPVAPTASFPYGLPDLFLKTAADGATVLKINPAFSEGNAAAFVMPEVWLNFDIVWVQPWYVLLTAWNEKAPNANRWKVPDGKTPDGTVNVPPVWDVSHHSLFYSPLWLVFYAVVPPNSMPERYTNAQHIFDDNLPVYPGPPIIYSVRPDDVGLEMKSVHPYLGTEVSTSLGTVANSFVDDEHVAYFTEGGNNWRYNERLEAEEVPLLFFAQRDAGGNVNYIPDVPPVMGSGPLLGRRPVDAPNGRPRFGGYSRLYLALVPATAEAFNPDTYPEATAALLAKMLNPNAYRGRVASNAKKVAMTDKACFTTPDFPDGCTWLDSQQRVEDAVGIANLIRTEVTACSPLVFYAGKGIGR